MPKTKILIVGGAGYIGSHCNKLLSRAGFETLVLDNLVYGHREFVKWGEFVFGDIADKNFLDLLFSSFHFDAVMHFSSYTYVGESVQDPFKYYENNVSNTLNLLGAMKKFGVKNFIFSSTCATFGMPKYLPLDESHVQEPINPYGWTKLMVEKMLLDAQTAYGLKSVILRYFNAAGADVDAEIGEKHNPETHLIPLVLDVAVKKREFISVFGNDYNTKDGTCVRDYIHVNDLSKAHILSLSYLLDGGKSEHFNLGNGKGFSVQEIIDVSRKITGKEIPVHMAPRRPGDPDSLVGSCEKISRTLGYCPSFADIDTIVKTAWNWHQKI